MKGRYFSIVSFLLCLCLLAGCASDSDGSSSSSGGNENNPGSNNNTISLAYSATDSLNPYTVKTKANGELVNLLFDSIVRVNNNFEPEKRLAERIDFNGTDCIITLREVYFTDKSRVTATDVIYSLDKAMDAENLQYSRDLQVIYSRAATGKYEVTIKLSHRQDYFLNCLDFPVYKAETDQLKNADKKEIPPIGSGRYVFYQSSGEYWLEANDKWYGGVPAVKRINLVNLPDDEAMEHAVRSESIDIFYSDLTNNSFPSMNGTSKGVSLSNLVYLGVNTSGSVLANLDIRRAVSFAVDRTDLVKSAFYSASFPAKGPCHINFDDAKGFQTLSETPEIENATKALEKSGYKRNGNDEYASLNGTVLTISLLYNSDNSACATAASLIEKDLKEIGIKVKLNPQNKNQYISSVKSYSFDMYLGEIRIPANMNLYGLVTAGGLISPTNTDAGDTTVVSNAEASSVSSGSSASAEKSTNLSAAQAAKNMENGTGTLAETLSCFNQQLPIIPLIHRSGVVCCSPKIKSGLEPVANDPYNGIEKCVLS